jgi:hypothetical protein
MIGEDIPFGNGQGMHIARMQCNSCTLEYRRRKIGWMIEEGITFGNGKGRHITRIKGLAIEYALHLLRLGIQEKEDRMDD